MHKTLTLCPWDSGVQGVREEDPIWSEVKYSKTERLNTSPALNSSLANYFSVGRTTRQVKHNTIASVTHVFHLIFTTNL